MLDENWKSVLFILLAFDLGPTLGQHHRESQKLVENIGPTLGLVVITPRFVNNKSFISLVEKQRANVGPTSRFANKKDFDWSFYQHLTNVGPTLIFTYKYAYTKRND